MKIQTEYKEYNVAVVVPTFRTRAQILSVLSKIGPEVKKIYVVDDACPQSTGLLVESACNDPRVKVIFHTTNTGVGGATITGYRKAMENGADIVVKLDSDGQMDPTLIPNIVAPLYRGECDYVKGNRFFDAETLRQMPKIRIFGNAILSLVTKISSGYWNLFDPTNGFTAIHASVLACLPLHKINNRFFFETDMLFRLNILRAVVVDMPMDARYGSETSNLKISQIIPEFILKHVSRTIKRVLYDYYLRDMSIASLELPMGIGLLHFGLIYGLTSWWQSASAGMATPVGTIMIAVTSTLLGIQLMLSFLQFDISRVPVYPIHKLLK